MARKRYGKRERAQLRLIRENGLWLMSDGTIVKRGDGSTGRSHNVRSCLNPDMLWPTGKRSRLWEWNAKTNVRVRRENKVSRDVTNLYK